MLAAKKEEQVPKKSLPRTAGRKRSLPSLRLIDIYKRIYGNKKPEGLHEAEGDVNVLFKIAVATPQFVDAIDGHAVPLTSIKNVW